jgi:aarF domain-containing kinase
VRETIALEMVILRLLVGYIRNVRKFNIDFLQVVDEWESSLLWEMDYEAEAQIGLKFRSIFGHLPQVVILDMYLELSSH